MEKVGKCMYRTIIECKEVDKRCTELTRLLQQLVSRVRDMDGELKMEELKPGKKQKKVVEVYLEQVKRYKEETEKVLAKCQDNRGKSERMWWMPYIQQHLREGQELLRKANRYKCEGLTYDEICKRGEKLLVGELVGETAHRHLNSVLDSIKRGADCIGIYGPAGAGKTNLMKHLYNKVYDDLEGFKAVFWAAAPNESLASAGLGLGLQESVAEAMWFKLDDNDEVRRASLLTERLKDMGGGSGRVILFLDNVRKDFPAYELLGVPSPAQGQAHQRNILVFTAPSKDVCNRMLCDLKLKMDLLPEDEAQELFLHEAGLNNHQPFLCANKEVVGSVAKQCARMPLAIILIARSLAGVEDIREWRNRLDELTDTIENIHEEAARILEQLKLGYICLNNKTAQRCFLASARLLTDHHHSLVLPKLEIINNWFMLGLIGRGLDSQLANDQGHTILNKLERMCLLEVVTLNGRDLVRMNKWIRKMAASITDPEGD